MAAYEGPTKEENPTEEKGRSEGSEDQKKIIEIFCNEPCTTLK